METISIVGGVVLGMIVLYAIWTLSDWWQKRTKRKLGFDWYCPTCKVWLQRQDYNQCHKCNTVVVRQ